MAFTARVADLIAEDKTGLLGKHSSWERVPLLEVASVLNGAPFDSALFSQTSGHPLVRIRDVLDGNTGTFYQGEWNDAYRVEQGDLLIGMDGDFNTGFWRSGPALLNQRVCKVSADETFYDQRFLAFALPGFLRAINANTPSITVKHLSSRTIGEIELPLPPRAEQTRIVEKLEELLSDLDAGVAELKAAQAKLQQYRQSLLKAAVEGSLTRAWREAHPAPEESGADLLARILRERRARWEAQQLAKFEAQGKAPPKGWQEKYPEPVVPRTSDLPSLPRSWTWATLSQIGWLDRGRSKHRPRNAPHLYGGPYPFVQTGDIRHADTYLRNVEASYSEAGLAQSRLWPESTLCITIAANIGKTAILGMAACFPDSVVGFLPASDAVSVRYVDYFMRSAQAQLEDEAPATAQKNINLETLERLCIPLPPEAEIREVVEALNRAFDGVKALDTAVDMGLKQSTAQRQNLLRAAFAGQLVPQDPADEPADALLARIRAERAERAPAKRRSVRKETA